MLSKSTSSVAVPAGAAADDCGHPTQLAYNGLLSSVVAAISPIVLQHTSDGNLTVAITGADSSW